MILRFDVRHGLMLLFLMAAPLCGYAQNTKVADDLWQSVTSNNVQEVRRLLDGGANPNAISDKVKDAASPLQAAAALGSLDVADLLIAKGANVNSRDNYQWTPLHLAAVRGHANMAEFLLSKGAQIEAKGFDGSTPLALALQQDNSEVVMLLVAKGANVNAKRNGGETPLMIATNNSDLPLATALLDHGADINTKDALENTALDHAFMRLELAYLVTSSSLSAATFRKSLGLSGALLERAHKEVAEVNAHGRELALLLINRGTDVNVPLRKPNAGKEDSVDVWTPLIVAALTGDAGVVELLIDKGADINATNNSHETALHVAVLNDHRDVAELILNKGANVNATSDSGRTPLHYVAIDNDDKELATLLILKGADVNAVDKDGRSPLAYANKRGHGAVAAILRAHGAK